jgi:leader peptidase (prepilin peptidase)/N-methyltransferase
MGDVSLAGVLGLLLGWLGWRPAVISVLMAFVTGGVIALIMLLTRRASRRSNIAFGPSMLLGAWLALMFAGQIVVG